MLAYIKGTVITKGDNFVVVENQNIGYKIFTTKRTLEQKNRGDVISMHLHDHIREDAHDLFGFESADEHNLFEKLISISGIGPKTALGVFAAAKADEILGAILSGDATILKQVSGIGAKTAERIIVELKSKIAKLHTDIPATQAKSSDALQALLSLGYSLNQATEAMNQVSADTTDTSEQVKSALKFLNQR